MKITDKTAFVENLKYIQVPKRTIYDLLEFYPDKLPLEVLPKEGSLFFHGKPGTGKTLLSIAAALDRLKRISRINPEKIIFGNASEILQQVKETYDPNFKPLDPTFYLYERKRFPPGYDPDRTPESNIIHRYIDPEILILDDMGTGKTTVWSNSTLYYIIGKRYEDMKVTFTTSNYSPEKLNEVVEDGRMLSRLLAECTEVSMTKVYRK